MESFPIPIPGGFANDRLGEVIDGDSIAHPEPTVGRGDSSVIIGDSTDSKGAWGMSLAELLPLVEGLSQPDKERLFEYLGDYVGLDDLDDESEEVVLESLRVSLKQVRSGKVHPIADLWEGINVGG